MASPNTTRKEDKDSADLYSTPTVALDTIKPYLIKDLENNRMNYILEPCSGLEQITDYLERLGNNSSDFGTEVDTNDLHDYGFNKTYNVDFLSNTNIPDDYDLIVTNPPYNKAVEFVLKGFEHAPIQWHFLRMSFLEGQKRYQELFSLGKLSDVYIFTFRVSCPKGVDMEPSPNSVCYCWMRFDKNYNAQPKLHWLVK